MRSRNIKPDFFLDEDLATLPFEARILFAGLWCCADKAGRLEDRPVRIRATVFPYDPVDVDLMLTKLVGSGQITRYAVNGDKFIQINSFHKHQNPHHTEKDSIIPEFNGSTTVNSPLNNGSGTVTLFQETTPTPLIPDSGSLNTDSGSIDSGAPIRTGKPVKPRAQAPAVLYRWEEFAAIYPPWRLKPDKAAKAWWGSNAKTDATVDAILAAVRGWLKSEQWQQRVVPNCSKFLDEGIWQAAPGPPRKVAQDDWFKITEPGDAAF